MQTLAAAWEATVHVVRLVWESAWYLPVFLRTSWRSGYRWAAEIVALGSPVVWHGRELEWHYGTRLSCRWSGPGRGGAGVTDGWLSALQ